MEEGSKEVFPTVIPKEGNEERRLKLQMLFRIHFSPKISCLPIKIPKPTILIIL